MNPKTESDRRRWSNCAYDGRVFSDERKEIYENDRQKLDDHRAVESMTEANVIIRGLGTSSFFFLIVDSEKWRDSQCNESPSNKSARSGLSPLDTKWFRAGSTRDAANETAQHTASILVKRRSHTNTTGYGSLVLTCNNTAPSWSAACGCASPLQLSARELRCASNLERERSGSCL